MELLTVLLVGGVAGWLGSMIYKGSGLGLFGNILVGLLGGWLGYWLFGRLGISLGNGLLGFIFTSAIGAIIILFLVSVIFGKRKT
ncbi:MAG TPA: GlsB/YeaQ/YmgE family stress response membrane protein [Cyclobacteriaceae bacterium]|jgi:uncharacterized membrane protein YeaQ/YmgE (transglycosylase-associated protein family)|nr:GlsB/YeaQ/YmgE family stress response membrane protein [Cyclobacteriaceae bacterium]